MWNLLKNFSAAGGGFDSRVEDVLEQLIGRCCGITYITQRYLLGMLTVCACCELYACPRIEKDCVCVVFEVDR